MCSVKLDIIVTK